MWMEIRPQVIRFSLPGLCVALSLCSRQGNRAAIAVVNLAILCDLYVAGHDGDGAHILDWCGVRVGHGSGSMVHGSDW